MKIKPLYLVFLLILTAVIIFLLRNNNDIKTILTIALSVIALFVSILSAFKNDIFPYNLQVFAEGLHLVKASAMPPSKGITIQVLLPVTFFNKGYGECFIKKVHLIVKPLNLGGEFIFLPAVEIDMQAFMRQKIGINTSNTIGSFVGFLLDSKKGIVKNIVFTPQAGPDKHQFNWIADSYTFEIHVLVEGEKKFKKYYELKQDISEKNLLFLIQSSNAIFFM
jgi:hypothetical protein